MKKFFYLVFLSIALSLSSDAAFASSMLLEKNNQLNAPANYHVATGIKDIVCLIDVDNKLCFDEDDVIDPGDDSGQECKPYIDPDCTPRPGNNDSAYCQQFPDMCSPQDPPKEGNSSPDSDAPGDTLPP